jgi:hypothetical protein
MIFVSSKLFFVVEESAWSLEEHLKGETLEAALMVWSVAELLRICHSHPYLTCLEYM